MTNQTMHKSAYPPKFRAEAIQLARINGKLQTVIARELGVSVETLPGQPRRGQTEQRPHR